MYCGKCGTANPDTSKFCAKCGATLAGETQNVINQQQSFNYQQPERNRPNKPNKPNGMTIAVRLLGFFGLTIGIRFDVVIGLILGIIGIILCVVGNKVGKVAQGEIALLISACVVIIIKFILVLVLVSAQ